MNIKVAASILGLSILPFTGFALTGEGLLKKCDLTSEQTAANATFCDGYLRGFFSGSHFGYGYGYAEALSSVGVSNKAIRSRLKAKRSIFPYCLSRDVSFKNIKEAVVSFIKRNPDQVSKKAYVVVHRALVSAYPCPRP